MSDFVVPDMIEPIVAWRVWHASDQGLSSLNSGHLWPQKERMEARCGGSEPITLSIVGWEAVPHRGDPVWVRDGRENEGLRPHDRISGATGPRAAYVTAVSSVSFVSPVMHMEPPPDRPSSLLLPVGWKWSIGTREELLPPRHTECPAENCGCGIYALKSKAATRPYGGDVVGEVYLWGKVIEGNDGYRAQYAYPKSLHPNRKLGGDARDALREYGLPDLVGQEDQTTALFSGRRRPWWRLW